MKIIVNPASGGGRGRRRLDSLHRILKSRGRRLQAVQTERQGHGSELARRLVAEGEKQIIVMGGDGTISEVVNGLLGVEVPIGLIPVGTGNDLARSLGIPCNRIEDAIEIVLCGRTKRIDLGVERDRRFLLMAAVGYPSHVAEEANRIKRLKGSWAFVAAVYKALGRMKPLLIRLTLDGESQELECTSVLVQNAPYCGGGQWMAPQASMEDGLLDVVVIGPIGRLNLMLNFPRVYKGTHVGHPAFSIRRASQVTIQSSEVLKKMFDGDLCGETPLEARTLHRAIRVIVPVE